MLEPVPSRSRELARALMALGAAILFWSCVPLLLKYFTRELDAWTVNGLRYTFALLFWLPYVLQHRRELPARSRIWRDAIPPAAIHVVGQVLFGLCPYFNDATVINFVSRAAFLFTTLTGFILLREERAVGRQPLFWIGMAATIAGLVAMYVGGIGTPSTSAFGMLLLLATAAFWGFYSVLVRKFMRPYSIRLSFSVISLYAAPGLLALMFALGDWRKMLTLGPGFWAMIWLSAVLGIALGHTLFYRAIHTIGPVASEGSLLLIPFVTAVLAHFLLDERLGRLQWIGGVILVGGCFVLLRANLRARGRVTAKEAQAAAPTPR
ncbi:MAG TPA: DMT family transporter [Kiritimatiellia bacterium]|nr:DMT family transporter [Kiritimatiellia bacterium]